MFLHLGIKTLYTMNKYVVIYFDAAKLNRQIIRPSDKFTGDWGGLVEAVTMSNSRPMHGRAIRNYHSFEVK